MDWDKLKDFYYVATTGSFTKAGARLKQSQSTLSRKIQKLEKELKVKLLNRDADGVSLTTVGQIWLTAAKEIMAKIKQTHQLSEHYCSNQQQRLKILSTPSLVAEYLIYLLPDLLSKHPNLGVEFLFSNPDEETLIHDISLLPLTSLEKRSSTGERRSWGYSLYASRSYLEKAPPIEKPESLINHQLIDLRNGEDHNIRNKIFHQSLCKDNGELRTPHITADSSATLLHLVAQGFGIASLAELSPPVREANLTKVFPRNEAYLVELECLIAGPNQPSRAVKEFYEYILLAAW